MCPATVRHCSFLTLALLVCGCGSDGESSEAAEDPARGRAASSPQGKVRELRDEPQSTDGRSPDRKPRDSAEASSPTAAQPVFRRSDNRPRHDDAALAQRGIRVYESERLKLYTDIEPEAAKAIPPLIDEAYEAWVAYFGKLPPNRERTAFQITGYLMADEERFKAAGLVPRDLRRFLAGRHRDYEFWMYDQEADYYRRHLAVHECTHCFMTCVPHVKLPVWYLEGMAELFGTHRYEEDGSVSFRVMPHDKEHFRGLGRITLIQQECEAGRFKTMADIGRVSPEEYLDNAHYAWTWAVCAFFDGHPRYSERFQQVGRKLGTQPFGELFSATFEEDQDALVSEWPLFAFNLQDGYDRERAAITFVPGKRVPSGAAVVQADRGWQSSEILLEKGRRYEVTAEGRFTLAEEPKPWVSEPQGISFRYFEGRPLGRLLGTIRTPPDSDDFDAASMLEEFGIGRRHEFVAPRTGTLYLRLNDSWSELADNGGKVRVEVREVR